MSLLKQLTSQITALQSKIPEELFQIKVQLKSALENSEISSLRKENNRLQKQIRKLEKQLIAVLLRENKKEVIDLSANDELVPIKEERQTPNTQHKNFIQKQNITITAPEMIEVATVAVTAVEKEDAVEEDAVAADAVEEDAVEEEEEVEEEEVEEEEDAVATDAVAADAVEEEVEEEEDAVAADAVEEEEEVEVEEEEVEEEEEEEVATDAVEDAVEEEEEEESVYEVVIKGKTYYVINEVDSVIYDADENGDISIEVGIYKAGVPTFIPVKI